MYLWLHIKFSKVKLILAKYILSLELCLMFSLTTPLHCRLIAIARISLVIEVISHRRAIYHGLLVAAMLWQCTAPTLIMLGG